MVTLDTRHIVSFREEFADSRTLTRYSATDGSEGHRKAFTMFPEAVANDVNDASLLGRGGVGFPAGREWSMLRLAPVSQLVVNGNESEPATFKDPFLVECDPHQLLENVIIAAYALQVTKAFIFLRGEFALGLERGQQAVNDANDHGALGSKFFGSDFSHDIVIHAGAGAYICGEETVLTDALEGKCGFSRMKPLSSPVVTVLYGEPTVVNNVETMANLPWIVVDGGAAFLTLDAGRFTGARLFALASRVKKPLICEIELVKNTCRELFYDPEVGGGIIGDEKIKAFIPGGDFAPWFGPDLMDLPLGQDEVTERSSVDGSGSVGVMDETSYAVRASWRITNFFSKESCDQCTPCRQGLRWVERAMYRMEHGGGRMEDLELLLDLCDNIAPGGGWPPQQTTICPLGPSIPSSVRGAISMFRSEFTQHVQKGGCPFD